MRAWLSARLLAAHRAHRVRSRSRAARLRATAPLATALALGASRSARSAATSRAWIRRSTRTTAPRAATCALPSRTVAPTSALRASAVLEGLSETPFNCPRPQAVSEIAEDAPHCVVVAGFDVLHVLNWSGVPSGRDRQRFFLRPLVKQRDALRNFAAPFFAFAHESRVIAAPRLDGRRRLLPRGRCADRRGLWATPSTS
jgi:hypothetical protein